MERCIAEVRLWVATNFLKLNASKIEFAFVGAKALFTKAIMKDTSIGERILPAKSIARNIGAVMDLSNGLQAHENMVGRSNCYHLRNIGKINKYMDVSLSPALPVQHVIDRIDYVCVSVSDTTDNSFDTNTVESTYVLTSSALFSQAGQTSMAGPERNHDYRSRDSSTAVM